MAPKRFTATRRKRLSEDLLDVALANRHRDVERLIEERADINAVDRAGYTPLSEAAVGGHTIVAGCLLRAFADPDIPARDGRTALHRAVLQNWIPTARLLLERGANRDIEDEDGAKPVDLVRTGVMKELIQNFDREENTSAAEERRKAAARLPPVVLEVESGEEAPGKAAAAGDKASGAEASAASKLAADLVAQREEEKRKANATKEAARVERERRYQEAVAEYEAQAKKEREENPDLEIPLALQPPPLVARVQVIGAPEPRLNGSYHASFASKDRVEFQKENDPPCQVYWSQYHDEWRMLIGDFKMGNILYRHKYRPNIKADEHLGIPKEGWQIWFGKGPSPTIRLLPPKGSNDEVAEQAVTSQGESGGTGGDRATGREQADTGSTPASRSAKDSQASSKQAEFIELRSPLEIVAPDASSASALTGVRGSQPGGLEVSLHGGERILETADGLFSPQEVADQPASDQAAVEDLTVAAAAWLNDTGDLPAVPAAWDSVHTAKSVATQLYSEGKSSEALQATTAALKAAERLLKSLEDPGSDEEIQLGGGHLPAASEVDKLLGVLHSNRALLLVKQINSGDVDVLAFGMEAAWHLVVKDSERALAADGGNFKASFHCAKGLFELGELDNALAHANRVIEHYSRSSPTPNPEAVTLRDRILAELQKENRKWGNKGPARWNRAGTPLITEVGGTSIAEETSAPASKKRFAPPARSCTTAVPKVTGQKIPAPRIGSDVEKALVSTLKDDVAQQLAYVKEHLPASAIQRFFKRTPLGPDLLALLVRVLRDLAAEDPALATEQLAAVAKTPSVRMDAEMFNEAESSCLRELLARLGPAGAAAWEVQS